MFATYTSSSLHAMQMILFSFLLSLATCPLFSQQQGDTTQFFTITDPVYPLAEGPVIFLDGGHNNFHTLEGRYAPFGRVLAADGYQIASQNDTITPLILAACQVYVIANPLHASNLGNWTTPNPSAFTPNEITALEKWVAEGGRLLLIADHMPFGGAVQDLAQAFDVEWSNCFAMDNRRRNSDRFSKRRGSLHEHTLTRGIDSIVSFTGSAFKTPEGATPIMSLSSDFTLLTPEVAWQFTDDTPYQSGENWHQLTVMSYGKGKLVLGGEAAMFTAQVAGPSQRKIGMNSPEAPNNVQLLRNILAWLLE
jgi:hypothetical protein